MLIERMRILLVEDDPGHAALLQRTLRRAGVKNELVSFADGGEVLEFLETPEPRPRELVLLDLQLPRVDGYEVLRQVKADERWCDVAVVVLTTTDDPREVEACEALGCEGYLVKPVDPRRFVDAVRAAGLLPLLEVELEG